MSAPNKLDLWIAATMRPSDDAQRRLATAGVSMAAAKQLALELKGAGLGNPADLDRSTILTLFGQPAESSGSVLRYDLTLWPLHRYQWQLDEAQLVSGSHFVVRDERSVASPSVHDLRPGLHTEQLVRQALGEPNAESGWWPEYTLSYGPMDDGGMLALTFSHGLLCQVEKRAPASR